MSRASLLAALLCLISTAYADESMQYHQKNLPNGDVETVYSSSDGAKVTSIQHKDGSTETTTITPDGAKSITVQHKDGSIDSRMIPAPADKN